MHPLSILYNLYQAVDECKFEEHPCMDQAINDISSTVNRIKILLKKLNVKQSTVAVIESLKASKVDYTLLLYLQLPKSIREKSELISCLETTCISMKADYTDTFFYRCVWEYFENKGIQTITPGKYVTARRKEDVLNEYERVRKAWGIHSPLFLQMYDTEGEVFTKHVYFIFKTVQDGVLRLLDILKTGEVVFNRRVYASCGAFEHVIGPSTVTCQLYDCEVMSSAFDEPTEKIKDVLRSFPKFLTEVMIKEELIDIEDFVTFSVKDRTRKIGNRDKISFHFTPFIYAPKAVHSKAVKICLKDYKDDIDETSDSIKKTGKAPDGLQQKPFRMLDYKAFNNGITTAFSRKTRTDIFPRYVYSEELCGGCTMGREECTINPQDLHGDNMTDKERLMLIYRQLYTTPKRDMICYTEDAMKAMSEKSGVAPTPHPQRVTGDPSPQRAPNTSSNNLPEWFLSDLRLATGTDISNVRCNLPFLEKLKSTLPEASRGATLHHVPSSCCAQHMATGRLHIHDKNATVFAYDSQLNVVYATCSTGSHKIAEHNGQFKVVNMYSKTMEDGSVQPVEVVKGKCVHWAMITVDSMRLFVETVKENGMEPPTKKMKT